MANVVSKRMPWAVTLGTFALSQILWTHSRGQSRQRCANKGSGSANRRLERGYYPPIGPIDTVTVDGSRFTPSSPLWLSGNAGVSSCENH